MIQGNPTKYERAKRQEIYILSLKSRFSPDVMTEFRELGQDRTGGMAMQPAPAARATDAAASPVTPNLPGFLLDFVIRCPNQGQFEYINNGLVANLRKAVVPDVAYVGGVRVPLRAQIKDGGIQNTAALMGGGRGGSGHGNVGGGGGDVKTVEKMLDPVTGEPMRDDWEYRGTIAVVLGTKPQTAAAGTPGTGGAAAEDSRLRGAGGRSCRNRRPMRQMLRVLREMR